MPSNLTFVSSLGHGSRGVSQAHTRTGGHVRTVPQPPQQCPLPPGSAAHAPWASEGNKPVSTPGLRDRSEARDSHPSEAAGKQ